MGLRFKTESHGELQECGARRAISPAFISSPALLHQHHAQPRATARFLQNAESVICMGASRCIGRLIKVCIGAAMRAGGGGRRQHMHCARPRRPADPHAAARSTACLERLPCQCQRVRRQLVQLVL
jgi:hypothetical protein